ncbi:hypothetical protein YSY43_16660 [Paenibacillus sp. YSY-4.3]
MLAELLFELSPIVARRSVKVGLLGGIVEVNGAANGVANGP